MDAINLDILKQLQEYAQMYFDAIVEANSECGKCKFANGKYTAKDVTKWIYALPCDDIFNEDIILESGTFKCKFPYRRIFEVLSDWETMCRAGEQKAVFEIGDVEERSAKCFSKAKTALGKYAETKVKMQRVCGNWWMPSKFKKSDYDVELFYELNGVIFIPGLRFSTDMIHNRREEVEAKCAQYDDAKMTEMTISFLAKFTGSENWGYFKEVADRAGVNLESEEAAAIIEKAKEEKRQAEERAEAERLESIRQREERERERKERDEQERREAAEHLAKAKENFVSGRMISRNDFELIAESVGYEINIRTVGTLRKRVEWIEVETDGTPTVYGTKRRAGLDGTFAVIREVYEIVKAKIKETQEPVKHISEIMETCRLHDERTGEETDEYKYYKWLTYCHTSGNYRTIADKALAEALVWIFEAAYRKGRGHIMAMNKDGMLIETAIAVTPTEVPRISTETAETANVSAEGEKTAKRAKYRVSRLSGYKIIVGDREQGKVIAVLMAVNGHNTIEINDESAHIATMGEKPLSIDKPIMQLSDAEVQELIYNHTEAPQSPETPQTADCTTDTPKPREMARKEPKRVIRNFRTTQPRTRKKFLTVPNVPRRCDCSTMRQFVDVHKTIWSPPIRGDCVKIRISARAKPPNLARRDHISCFKPP